MRREKCKAIVTHNRLQRADGANEKRVGLNLALEEQAKREAADVEKEKRARLEKERASYKLQREAEKSRKRGLNIEIASELIDLIMDVADEAFELTEELALKEGLDEEDQLITKPQWREWIDIFVSGMKVSEYKLKQSMEGQAELESERSTSVVPDSMAELMSAVTDPYQLLNEVQSEATYDDFLQYICMCGPLNLRLVAADKWHQFRSMLNKDKPQNSQSNLYLNELFIPKNYELGKFLINMYSSSTVDPLDGTLTKMDATLTRTLANPGGPAAAELKAAGSKESKLDFPDYHSLKLCLMGKAYAGKKTQA